LGSTLAFGFSSDLIASSITFPNTKPPTTPRRPIPILARTDDVFDSYFFDILIYNKYNKFMLRIKWWVGNE
jgi:hypothetical protein